MSLYVFAVPVTDEQADKIKAYTEHRQSLSIFSDHRCWDSNCRPDGLPSMYEDGLQIGRPMHNLLASEMESHYGEVFTVTGIVDCFDYDLMVLCRANALLPEGCDSAEAVNAWFEKNQDRKFMFVNDNEY